MGYTYYNPLQVWLDPASIADVVSYMQKYLSENPIKDTEEINQIIADYIAAHPEIIGGVQSVNGETGAVVLTASDINTTGTTTIQAVLTSLSSQISDIAQTVTGLDSRVTANATGITNEATARANADTALDNRITSLQGAVGSPLLAATAAAMTDTSKIYVYTGSETGYTNGNWYYYNGTAWTSGGVYNAVAINTDSTLTVAGMAADAKATGDRLNDLKVAITPAGLIPIQLTNKNKYYNTGGSIIDPETTSSSNNFDCVSIDCYPGEKFTITGTGNSASSRPWAFIDSTNHVLSVAGYNNVENEILTAPINASKLILNNRKSVTPNAVSYYGANLNVLVSNASEKIDSLDATFGIAFERGGISAGNDSSSDTYARSAFYHAYGGDKIIYDGVSTTESAVYIYDLDETYLSATTFVSLNNAHGEYKFTSECLFRIRFRQNNNPTLTYSDVDTLGQYFTLKTTARNLDWYNNQRTIPFGRTDIDFKNCIKNADKTILFFSDLHSLYENMVRIVDYANTISADVVINGGDVVNTINSEDVTWYNYQVDKCDSDVLMAVGNHDMWPTDGSWEIDTPTNIYNKFIAPIASKVENLEQPTGASTNGLCYYYKDYGDLRIIVLAANVYSQDMLWTADQLNWFEDVLADAKTNSKAVICVNHSPFVKNYAVIKSYCNLNSWRDYKTYSVYDSMHISDNAVQAVENFKSSGGNFICWLTGHTHADYLMKHEIYSGQLAITIATANATRHRDGSSCEKHEVFRPCFDCFDIIGVDLTNGVIKINRIGWDEDASMRIRTSWSYDYVNNKFLIPDIN